VRLPRLLDSVEARLLGVLLEKQQTTPEVYPLTLNSALLGANQRSNREPVMDLSEAQVKAALERLRELVLVWKVTGSRAEKWEHNLDLRWELDPPGKAVLCLLLLRGPQTPGELRSRSERLHPFSSLEEVEAALRTLASGPEPLVAELPRRPGQKEARFAHLACGAPEDAGPSEVPAPVTEQSLLESRVSALEAELARLRAELAQLKAQLGAD